MTISPDQARTRPSTKCNGCGFAWTSRALCHCAGCHHSFGSFSAFARHQGSDDDGRVVCHDPATATATKGDGSTRPIFEADQRGVWRLWVSDEARQALAELRAKRGADEDDDDE